MERFDLDVQDFEQLRHDLDTALGATLKEARGVVEEVTASHSGASRPRRESAAARRGRTPAHAEWAKRMVGGFRPVPDVYPMTGAPGAMVVLDEAKRRVHVWGKIPHTSDPVWHVLTLARHNGRDIRMTGRRRRGRMRLSQ